MSRIQCTSFSSVVSLPVTAVHGATPAPARHSPQRRRLCARPRAVGHQARRRQPPHRRPLPLVPRARLRGTSRDLDLQSAPNQRNTPAIAYACWVARRPRSRQRVDEGTSARSRQGSSAAAIGGRCSCPEAATSDKSVGVATVAAWGCNSEGSTEVAPACRPTRRYVVPRLRPRPWSCCDRAARRLIEPLEQWPSDRHRGTRPAVRASLIAARTDGKRPARADRPQLGRLWCAASSSHSTRVGGPLTPPS
jgi:hypothetical protein